MIYKNCVLYNLEGSPIVALAAELISTLLASFTTISTVETSEVPVARYFNSHLQNYKVDDE